jgi:hypothetical protein
MLFKTQVCANIHQTKWIKTFRIYPGKSFRERRLRLHTRAAYEDTREANDYRGLIRECKWVVTFTSMGAENESFHTVSGYTDWFAIWAHCSIQTRKSKRVYGWLYICCWNSNKMTWNPIKLRLYVRINATIRYNYWKLINFQFPESHKRMHEMRYKNYVGNIDFSSKPRVKFYLCSLIHTSKSLLFSPM